MIVLIHGIGNNSESWADNIKLDAVSVCWDSLLINKEKRLQTSLGYSKIRKLFFDYGGDLTAYSGDYYGPIHEKVNQKLFGLSKLTIVAHSLGCVIANNFIYDLQNPDSPGNNYFKSNIDKKAIEDCTLITLGNPLFLYAIGKDFKPIKVKKWINITCPSDVIAYPVRDIPNHNLDYIEDKFMRVGNLIEKWTPWSHGVHLYDKKVLDLINSQI